MATKVWRKREYYSRSEFTSRPRLGVYNDLLQQAREQNPTATNSHLRRITASQLAFISNWSTHSVYHMDPKHRDQFLTALTKWHETHAEQALTGESPLKAYIQSPDFTEHLKEWWDAITPSLYNHFLCRNRDCKSVILNSHWLRAMDNNSPKQGVYLCPKCLETYRPFSGISYNKNIGELVPAKQCLVIKVPAQHSANAPIVGGQQLASTDTEHTYHCFLMQWPETDTQYLLNTMKQITADLLEGWIQAEDKVLFLHSKLMAHLQKTQLLPYMKREAWTQNNIAEIQNRNTQAGSNKYKLDLPSQNMESQDGLPWVLLWLLHLCVYGRDSNPRAPWSHRFDVVDVHPDLSHRNWPDRSAKPPRNPEFTEHLSRHPFLYTPTPSCMRWGGLDIYYEHHYVTESLACDWCLGQIHNMNFSYLRHWLKHVIQRGTPSHELGDHFDAVTSEDDLPERARVELNSGCDPWHVWSRISTLHMNFQYIMLLPNNTTLRVQDTQVHTHDNRYRIDPPHFRHDL